MHPATTAVEPDEMDFDAAFAAMSKDDETSAITQVTENEGAEDTDVAEGDGAEVAEGDGAEVADGADVDDGAEGDGADVDGVEGDGAAQVISDDDLMRRFAALVRKAEPQAPAPAAVPQIEASPVYTPEEQKLIEDYQKDWPDVARAESLVRRAEYRQIVDYVFNQIASQMRPLAQTVDVLATRTHLGELQSKVTDYEDIRDKVVAWSEKQPAYLKAAYEHVIKEGTVEEVADLIDRYRRETGASSSSAPGKTQPRQTERELPPATKQAAAALAPVGSKRSAPAVGTPVDFSSAFDEFASRL